MTYWEQYGLTCWNGLSEAQQARLIEWGNLPMFSKPEGTGCQRPAQVAIETEDDTSPGVRFYCRSCAILALGGKLKTMAEVRAELADLLELSSTERTHFLGGKFTDTQEPEGSLHE